MNNTVRALAPFLSIIAILMIVAGAALAACFGFAAWQVLYHPEKVTVLSYILGDIATNSNTPALMATLPTGQVAEYRISPAIKMFGLAYLFISGLGLLVSVARCMSDIGVHIIKVLAPPPPAPVKKKPASPAAAAVVNAPPQTL